MPRRAAAASNASKKPATAAVVEREYGPFPDAARVHGVTFDGESAWFAAGDRLQSFDPNTGLAGRSLPVAAEAGTAFDGKHLFQIAAGQIQKIDPKTGQVLSVIPAPGGARNATGLTWAEGTLWVGQYGDRAIHQLDPESGRILRTIESDRFVTGVTFLDDQLWHGSDEDGVRELRHVDLSSGAVLERVLMPEGADLSGLEVASVAGNGERTFLCGGGRSGKIRAVQRPR